MLSVKKIDKYLIQQFTSILLMSLFGFFVIFIIVDVVENLDKFIDASVPANIIVKYYLYISPWFLNIALPMAMLIATIFTIGLLSKHNELTAMKSSGISLYRISMPLILFAIIVSIASFYFEDRLVTFGNQHQRSIEKEYLGKSGKKGYRERRRNIFLQKSDKFHIAIDRYQTNQEKAVGVAMQFLKNGFLFKRIDAKWMKWNEKNNSWNLHVFAIREFDPDGYESNVYFSEGDTSITIDFSPQDLSQEAITPEEKNYSQLKEFIKELKNNGVDTTRWEVNLHHKISFSFTNFIVVLFALPLVSFRPKSGLAFGAGMSVFVIFGYYAIIRFGQILGFKGILEPFISAWIGNVIFTIAGILLMIFVRK